MIPDSVIRFLGGDPHVYRPIARAQSLILSRRSRLDRGIRGGPLRALTKGLTPFQLRCILTTVFSLSFVFWILRSHGHLVGVAFALTGGAAFLILDLVVDKFDVLADSDEYQVIASHPHDAWSVVLAKIIAVGRSTATLAACAFTFPAIASGFVFHSVGVALAFALAAAIMTVAIGATGMLGSAALIAVGGRTALQRLLPVLHLLYASLYFAVIMARRVIVGVSATSVDALGWMKWAVPTIWFAAPVEMAAGQVGPTTLARGALALVSILVVVPLCASWVRTRFDERILEPVIRRKRKATVATRARVRHRGRASGTGIFARLFLAHLRGDNSVRGGVFASFMVPLFTSVSTWLTGPPRFRQPQALISIGAFQFLFVTSILTSVLTTSGKPAALWCLLAAPRARAPFSSGVVWVLRLVLLLPIVIAGGVFFVVAGKGPLAMRILYVALLAILCDTALVATRGLNPVLPFSLPVKSRRRVNWPSLLGMIGLCVMLGLVVGAFIFVMRFGPLACAIPVLYATAMRVGAGFWAGWRVRRAALAAEAV